MACLITRFSSRILGWKISRMNLFTPSKCRTADFPLFLAVFSSHSSLFLHSLQLFLLAFLHHVNFSTTKSNGRHDWKKEEEESLKWWNRETMGCFFLWGYGGCKGRIYRVDLDPQFTGAYSFCITDHGYYRIWPKANLHYLIVSTWFRTQKEEIVGRRTIIYIL